MADDKTQIQIGADTGQAQAGINQLATTVQTGFAQMQQTFQSATQEAQKASRHMVSGFKDIQDSVKDLHSGVTGAFDKIVGSVKGFGVALVSITAIMAGGSAFKGLISDAMAYVSEAKKLSEVMHININDAAGYVNAYKRVGVESEQIIGVLKRFQVQVRTKGDDLEAMGLKLTDSAGKLRPLNELFEDSKKILVDHEEGINRNMAAQTMWGARVDDVNKILKVNDASVQESKKFLESLGLTIGPEMVKQVSKFKEGMVDMQTILFALGYKIASEVMPYFVRFGTWMKGEGKQAFEVLAGAISVTAKAFGWMASAAASAARAAALAAQQHMPSDDALKTDDGSGEGHSVRGTLGPPLPDLKAGKKQFDLGTAGGKGSGGGGGADKSRMQEWLNELQQMQMAQKNFTEMSKEEEKKFWQAKLAQCQQGTAEYMQVYSKIYALSKDIYKQQVKDAQDAEKDKVKIAEMELQKNTQLARLDIEMERENIRHKHDMGMISKAQELIELRKLKQQEHQIEVQALENSKKLHLEDKAFQEKMDRDILVLKRKNSVEISKIDHQLAKEESTLWGSLFSNLTSGFTNLISGLLDGTTNFAQSALGLLKSLAGTVVEFFAKMAFEWIKSLLLAGTASKVTATQEVINQAGVGYAAAMASISAIPIVGPGLAPGIASGIMASIMGVGLPMASAAGGWDVPADSVAQIHKNEMVLPAYLADRVRNMTGAGGNTINISYAPVVNHRMTADDYRRDARMMVAAMNQELGNQGVKIGRR